MKNIKILFAASVLMTFAMPAVYAAVETKNLLRNGDFEEPGTPPAGWKITTSPGESFELTSNAFTGKNALKISLPVAGDATALSDPCDVIPGEDYLFTYWGRGDGAKDGGLGYSYIVWQDANGKELTSTWTNYFSPLPDYQSATYTVTAPAGAAKALVRFLFTWVKKDYTGPVIAFYIDQVRLMKLSKLSIPADAQKWEFLSRQPGNGSKMVDDKDAANGQAVIGEPDTTKKNTPVAYGYLMEQPVGEYLAIFRVKVKDNTKKEPVAGLLIDLGDSFCIYGLSPEKILLASDFKQPGVYQDFAIRFVRPDEKGLPGWAVYYLGATGFSYDKITIIQLGVFKTDKEQAAIWLGE